MGNIDNRCDGHCETCNINQRTYCAAQIAYYNQQEIGEVKRMLQTLAPIATSCLIKQEHDTMQRETVDAEQGENLKTEVL